MDSDILEKKENLTQKASKGAFWGMSSNIVVSMISFVGTAVLARILSPKDFGLIGMAMLVTGIVELFSNLGLGAALIHKKTINEEYLCTAFWSSIAVSISLFLIASLLSPLAALFFKESVIKWIIISLSINFIISSFTHVHTMLLYKQIRLKNIAVVEVISRFFRVMVILLCALMGLKFWSIVIGIIAEKILKTILFWRLVKWRPALVFSKEKFKELFSFGKNVFGQGFLAYLGRNMDFIVTGKLLGAGSLGVYQFSYNLPYLVNSYVESGIGPVAFPVFSKVNDDKERLARGVFRAVKLISILIFPLMTGLSFCANDFINVAYGEKWLLAAAPLRLLCFSAALATIHGIMGYVFNALGRPDVGFKLSLFRLPLTIGLVILFSRWGIIGIAGAMFLMDFIATIIPYIVTRFLNVSFSEYLKSLFPAIFSSLIMVAGLFIFNQKIFIITNLYIRFISNILLGAVLYSLALFLLFKVDFYSCIDFIKISFRKNKSII